MTEADGKVADGKGLDNVVFAVLAAYVLQNGFIERTPDGELEVRVMSKRISAKFWCDNSSTMVEGTAGRRVSL